MSVHEDDRAAFDALVRQLELNGHDPYHDVPHPADSADRRPRMDDNGQPQQSPYERLQARILTGDAIRHVPPPTPLVEGLLFTPGTSSLYGPPGVGKTHVALDLALNVAHGRRWLGRHTTATPVLYVVGEGVAGLGQRVDAWCDHHQTDVGEVVTWCNGPVNLLDPTQVEALTLTAGELHTGLVILDTLARCTVGAEENSARDMGQIVEAIERVRNATGGHVVVVHHSGKDTTAGLRGSSALLGALDTVLKVTGGQGVVNIAVDKQKDAPTIEPLWGRIQGHANAAILVAAGAGDADYETAWAILTALRTIAAPDDPAAPKAWIAAAAVPEPTFHRARRWLLEQGFVTVTGNGNQRRYAPAERDTQEPF